MQLTSAAYIWFAVYVDHTALPFRCSYNPSFNKWLEFDPKLLISQKQSNLDSKYLWRSACNNKVFEICAKKCLKSLFTQAVSKYGDYIINIYTHLMYQTHAVKWSGKSCVYVYLKCSYSQNMRIIFMKGIGTQVSQQCWGTAGGPSLLEGRQSHLRGFLLMTKSQN